MSCSRQSSAQALRLEGARQSGKPLATASGGDPWAPTAATAWVCRAEQLANAAQVAEMLASTWSQIDAALRPVLGLGGLAALYQRSLYLTVPSKSWLMGVYQMAESTVDTAPLKAAIAAQTQADGVAAGGAMLLEFYQLLARLISPLLAARLLRNVVQETQEPQEAQEKQETQGTQEAQNNAPSPERPR